MKSLSSDLTKGNTLTTLLRFSAPFIISYFLQKLYGLADLYIIGCFHGAEYISAVSIGSQIMHMLTVIIIGLAMGGAVTIGRMAGAKDKEGMAGSIGNTISLFMIFAVVVTILLICSADGMIALLATPREAVVQTRYYLLTCFAGIPFITAYNVLSSIFRGLGDSKRPMYFVTIAGMFNIILDILFIGPLGMGAMGAALATVLSQTVSVLLAILSLRRLQTGIVLRRQDFLLKRTTMLAILQVGVPVAFQDGFIQISFLVITAIANQRGVAAAASVGIVEKIISTLFLVPSAMLSSISAIVAQNIGAGLHQRGRQVLRYGIIICVAFGTAVTLLCQFLAPQILGIFAGNDIRVVEMGSQYLKAYVFDCIFAGIHFCFSGYFCACSKAIFSFIHNLAAIILIRIPAAYLTSEWFPDTLYPMGLSAPAGSLLSAVICVIMYYKYMEFDTYKVKS